MQHEYHPYLLHNNVEHFTTLVLLDNQVKGSGPDVLNIWGASSEDRWRQVHSLDQELVDLGRPAENVKASLSTN